MYNPRKRNVTTSMAGLKTVTYAKISPKTVNPRDIAGNAEEEEEEEEAQKANLRACPSAILGVLLALV